MKILSDTKLDYSDVLIVPKHSTVTSRNNVNLETTMHFKRCHIQWTGKPIIASNMDTIGTFDVYDVLSKHNIITCFHKFYSAEDFALKYDDSTDNLNPELFMISSGINTNDLERLDLIIKSIPVKYICIDIANGYLQNFVEACKLISNNYPHCVLVAGNVATPEMTETLIVEGNVDIVKIGIGPGSACLTRTQTGVGIPQFSAVLECAERAHKLNRHVIADGGITSPGDLGKAFGAGADFIMLGGVLSGHDENPGEIIVKNEKKYKAFYGMSSEKAMKTHYGAMSNYRSSEGRELTVPYKGSLEKTVHDYLGGLRSTCTYINAESLNVFYERCQFVKVNHQINTIYAHHN